MDKLEDLLIEKAQLPPVLVLKYFKATVRSLMKDASEVLERIARSSPEPEAREDIYLLEHYLDYTRRLCEEKDDGHQN